MKDKTICIICGGQSSERDVSIRTGSAVYKALNANGYNNSVMLDLDFNHMEEILSIKPDVCFNALHGKVGEDGVLQKYLSDAGIKYTGTGVNGSRIAFDKHLSKEKFISNDISTPKYALVEPGARGVIDIHAPCVVKPAREGSTIGISIVKDETNLDKAIDHALSFDNKVIVEEYISGKELTVSIFNDEVYAPIWIKPRSGFYDYDSKYTPGATDYIFDLGINSYEVDMIKNSAVMAYNAVGCRGVGRIDIIYDGKHAYVLEINTVPGMTETSLFPKAALKSGITFIELIEKMLKDAFRQV